MLLVSVSFAEETYSQYEHRGPICPTLVLTKSAPTDIVIKVRDNSSTAVGETYIHFRLVCACILYANNIAQNNVYFKGVVCQYCLC